MTGFVTPSPSKPRTKASSISTWSPTSSGPHLASAPSPALPPPAPPSTPGSTAFILTTSRASKTNSAPFAAPMRSKSPTNTASAARTAPALDPDPGRTACDSAGRIIHIAGSLRDTTARRMADPLTGLPNRAFFVEHLEHRLERGFQHADWNFALSLSPSTASIPSAKPSAPPAANISSSRPPPACRPCSPNPPSPPVCSAPSS